MAKSKTALGKLKPRYSFILNPHSEFRLSKCPTCQKLTHLRKFALFIFIEGVGPIILGKTCRYCSKCELIMAHQDELEGELALSLQKIAPQAIGNEYFVVGTFDKKLWQSQLQNGENGENKLTSETFNYLADFKKTLDLNIEPGGWYRE
ncbi:hypothetical protein QT971_27770 [Microcoleus sp. herbarium19]|uniref:hypothetical protein n=1 Tax=unclassified Microcoleus TaxID=2642155 RepID=UPI002FCFB83D